MVSTRPLISKSPSPYCYYYYYYLFLFKFSTPELADGFSLKLDSKFSHVSMTLFSVLADFNNAVVCIISTRPLFPSLPVPVSIFRWVYKEHQIQLVSPSLSYSTLSSGKSKVFISLFVFFQFHFVVSRDSKVHNLSSSLLLLDNY